MQTTTPNASDASAYAPGEVLTRCVSVREFVAEFAPDVAEDIHDLETAFREMEAEGHAEARRLALPVSPDGIYPIIVWDVAWARQGFI